MRERKTCLKPLRSMQKFHRTIIFEGILCDISAFYQCNPEQSLLKHYSIYLSPVYQKDPQANFLAPLANEGQFSKIFSDFFQ